MFCFVSFVKVPCQHTEYTVGFIITVRVLLLYPVCPIEAGSNVGHSHESSFPKHQNLANCRQETA